MKSITWQSPSNIALIKYWGKTGNQIPKNPSISFTLKNAYTETTVHYKTSNSEELPKISLLFEGNKNLSFEQRLQKFIHSIVNYIPVLKGIQLKIESKNSFPHSTGIASSASAMSALALCLVSIEKELMGSLNGFEDFYKKASFIARLGSGSAARSIYGGVNLWGQVDYLKESSNILSIDITKDTHPVFNSYNDAILLVSNKEKQVSSSVGHNLMNNHPFAEQKFIESYKNTSKMLDILACGDQNLFAELVEAEALSLHAMMMTSNPNYLLMEANTLSIIQKIRDFRIQTQIQACFTLDAGANVHLLYPNENKERVESFIKSELVKFCSNNQWISDKVGDGPKKIG